MAMTNPDDWDKLRVVHCGVDVDPLPRGGDSTTGLLRIFRSVGWCPLRDRRCCLLRRRCYAIGATSSSWSWSVTVPIAISSPSWPMG